MAEGISKINVLELNSGFFYAGGARNLYSFCRYLNRDFFNVYSASYGVGGPGEAILSALGIEFVVADGNVNKITEFIKQKNINIIHIHRSGVFVQAEFDIIQAALKVNKNIVVVEKNVFGNYDSRISDKIKCSMFQSMMHLNERYLKASGARFDFKKMKVLYNMVDKDGFEKHRISEREIADYKKELGIEKGDYVIGKIARPHIAKWSDLVLDMMPYLVKEIKNTKFVIMGVPESRIKMIEHSRLKKHFIILDETSDEKKIHRFYQSIDVLAHSSKIGECNGNTINEAMFWGKPVVTNSTPRRDNGQLEQVFHMRDGIVANFPQTFAKALIYLYNNPNIRIEFGKKARNKILEINSPKNIVRQLEKVFMESLDRDIVQAGLADVAYKPSELEIVEYISEYRRRLKWEFGNLSKFERLANLLRIPRKLYFKASDYLEHQSYGK